MLVLNLNSLSLRDPRESDKRGQEAPGKASQGTIESVCSTHDVTVAQEFCIRFNAECDRGISKTEDDLRAQVSRATSFSVFLSTSTLLASSVNEFPHADYQRARAGTERAEQN